MNVAANEDLDMQEVIRLGTAAFHNQQNQRANSNNTTTTTNKGKAVTFASGAEDSSG